MATIKYKDENGEWKELTILKGDSGVAPIINKDTNTWLVWDDVEGAYIDSGVVAGVGTQDFVSSTYWVFNEMTAGKKVIADALTNRNYPTDKGESFNDMAQKITDMSYGLGIFEKIGYTESNTPELQEMVDYSYELAKGWNPDGSTAQMFRDNKDIVFLPVLDWSNVTSGSYVFQNCVNLTTIGHLNLPPLTDCVSIFDNCGVKAVPNLSTKKCPKFDRAFNNCTSLRRIEGFDLSSASSIYVTFSGSPNILYMKIFNLGKSTLATYDFSGASVWGIGSDENRQSLIDSIITYSYDRASNGMATATIKLSANTKALLTDDEIAQITAKGFTIS